MIRVIVINPAIRTVVEVHLRDDPEHGASSEIRRVIGGGFVKAASIRGFGAEDIIYVDDEALAKPPVNFFVLRNWTEPLPGIAVIVGIDGEGASVSVSVSLKEVEKRIRYPAITRV